MGLVLKGERFDMKAMGMPPAGLKASVAAATARRIVTTVVAVALALANTAVAQSPVKETLAYSRETIPGIPPGGPGTSRGPGGGSQNPFLPSYFIYVVIAKGTPIVATEVCIRGKLQAATLKKVESPVVVEHDPGLSTGEKVTLVKKTTDDVYQVELLKAPATACKEESEEEKKQPHEVTVYLQSGEAKWRGRAERIVLLHPARAM